MPTSTIVISDIHIGDNSPTCWYQAKVHEAKLARILQWILDTPDSFYELVILGDLFDFWTYPPNRMPPTVDQIIAANPNILGPNGYLNRVVQQLKGNVFYLNGNHDMNVTQDDLNKISPNQPYQIHKWEWDPYVLNHGGTSVAFTHGHNYCIFNAPDDSTDLAPLPTGHFVTRMIAYNLWQDPNVRSGIKTAADVHAQGGPSGMSDMLAKLGPTEIWNATQQDNFAGAMLQRFAAMYNVSLDQVFQLPNGSITLRQACDKYNGLWARWVNKLGGGDFGKSTAYKSLWADSTGDYMGWFAQKIAMEEGADNVIMGHTHAPKSGIKALNNYVNAGFECPAVPDADKPFNFVLLNWQDSEGVVDIVLQKVVPNAAGKLDIQPFSAPTDEIVGSSAMDFSCYVEIVNHRSSELVLTDSKVEQGHWVVTPPRVIPGGFRRGFWIQDEGFVQQLKGLSLSGIHGTGASASYRNEDGSGQFTLNFQCPTGVALPWPLDWSANKATATDGNINIRTRVGDGAWGGAPSASGHPLVVQYTVT